MMVRDHSVSNKPSQKPSQGNNSGSHSQRIHAKNHRVVHFEPFCLLSPSDESIKKAAEMVESASLNRFKVCVVSIISKDAIDESVKDQIAHSLLARNIHDENNRGKRKQRHNNSISDNGDISGSFENESPPSHLINDYENQVIGQIDTRNDVIVLNLTSMYETNKLETVIQRDTSRDFFDLSKHQPEPEPKNSKLLDMWPLLNQNLIKTLLILMTMSHIVIFYNPELAIDYNLILTLKILENMRIKSQNRLLDLLETIASKHTFPQQWVRQGRISCPRALFVCGTNNLGFDIKQKEFANVKRGLEDQIYRLMKRANLIFRPPNSGPVQQTNLLSLPPRDDFVFILAIEENQNFPKTSRISTTTEKSKEEDFYNKLLKSFTIRDKYSSDNDHDLASIDKNSSQNNQEGLEKTVCKFNASMQNKLRRFLLRHVSDIQTSSQVESENKSQNPTSKQSVNSVFLPRYDDFFTVLLRLKCLLLPATQVDEETSDQFSHHAIKWSLPDERRFVDIFDSVNTDELFSKRHCHKTRLAAYEFYVREMQVTQPNAKAHEHSLDSARKLYLNHARGPACDINFQLLIEQCNQYWQNSMYTKFSPDETRKDGNAKFNRLARTKSSEPSVKDESRSRTSLSINRRANGINMTTSCECGRQSSFMIVPVDRKKKLERVDIYKNND